MISVYEATKDIVKRSHLLQEAISSNIINYSLLARNLKPSLEKKLQRKISEHSIIMSLKRLQVHHKTEKGLKDIFIKIPEITIRSNLTILSIKNSESFDQKILHIFEINQRERKKFFILNEGASETTILLNSDMFHQIKEMIEWEEILLYIPNVSSITVSLTKDVVKHPGIFSQFLRILASEEINVLQLSSTYLELTIVVKYEEADKTFSVLKALFA